MKNTERRLAFVFSGLYVGGAEKFGITLANQFAEKGTPVIFILFETVDSPYYRMINDHIQVFHIARSSKIDLAKNRAFKEILLKNKISDVIFFCLKPLMMTRIFTFKDDTKVNSYVTLHSSIPKNLKEYLKTRIFLSFFRKKDHTVFICKNQRDYYRKKYHFGPDRQGIIYNGVDMEHFRPEVSGTRPEKRNELGIQDGEKIILLVATLRPEKGHKDAIRALELLHKNHPQIPKTHLVCIGGGQPEYIAALKELAKQLKLEQHVHLEGIQKDVRPYYGSADLFTLTSVSVETFSIAALEAMAFGLPLSLTDIGGASEMVVPGVNGSLSESGNPSSIAASWFQLLNTNFDKDKIRQWAVNNFSIDKTFSSYSMLINSNPIIE